MKIVSSDAMTRIDRRTQAEFAVPSTILMEDAGVKAWSAAREAAWDGHAARSRVVFLAGKGNNGGDALVMARQAAVENARALTVVLAAGRPERGTDPHTMLVICEALGIECLTWPVEEADVRRRCAEAGWFFDGIAGTGIKGALRPPVSELVELVNASPGKKIAIDVPSGIGDGFRSDHPAVRADMTLTMGLPKLCLFLPRARGLCGRIIVIPVGFPPALVEDAAIPGAVLARSAWRRLAPPIPADTYKNRRGHLAVFAGARGTTGAAWLCASAAARSRVGLVTLFIDPDAYQIVAPKLTSVMCRAWEVPARQAATEWDASPYSAALVGPGWGLTDGKENWLERLIATYLTGVIDADGISLLGRIVSRGRVDLGGRWVLTPHPGEFSRLTGVSREEVLDDPVPRVLDASARLNAVVALKGSCTIVAVPQGKYWVLDGQIPALATGGSGDVLAGIIAAGIAGGMGPLDAALFGVSLHASVGRLAARRLGWFLAEDLVPLISRVLSRS
jgi:NAD(P)H-hydrate epimerase